MLQLFVLLLRLLHRKRMRLGMLHNMGTEEGGKTTYEKELFLFPEPAAPWSVYFNYCSLALAQR